MTIPEDDYLEHHEKADNRRPPVNRLRLVTLMSLFGLGFAIIAGRLVTLAVDKHEKPFHTASVSDGKLRIRPAVIDRNGKLLASDIRMPSLYADPKKILDVDDAVDKILSVLPALDRDKLRRELEVKSSRFAWVKRGLTPDEASKIHDLGLPGLHFKEETRRVYPAGKTAAHVLGFVNIDNRGRAGIETYIDKIAGIYFPKRNDPGAQPPVALAMDLGVQYVVREKLEEAMKRHRAVAGAGLLLDVRTGEVIAMTSLPDFDPNHRAGALKEDRFDRLTAGTFELGSVFKTITVAMALEIGGVKLTDSFDATAPIKIGKFKIHDYHAENRELTVPEIFIHSSNIGAARLADHVGSERHREFLGRLGLLNPMETELGPVATPNAPEQWRRARSLTISYGHGISVAPLQFASAASILFNGGKSIPVTFLKRSKRQAQNLAQQVLAPETSKALRELMRLNVTQGTGKAADVSGFNVGGKTGTADKVVDGTYSNDKLLNSFLAIFPAEDPEYLLLVMLDEPKPSEDAPNIRPTAGITTAPLAGEIISRIGPMLGILPTTSHAQFDEALRATY